MSELINTAQIIADGRVVWVNAPDGSCIGRFGRLGVDVHRSVTAQLAGEPECLVCTHGKMTPAEWALFVDAMAEQHNVTIEDRHVPRFLQIRATGKPLGASNEL